MFNRYYIAPSHTKRNFRGTLKMRVQDGTHVTSSFFAGIFLVCVTVDPNWQVKLLAFARVSSETKANWLWFEGLLQKDFPGTRYIHADYSKGVESAEFGQMLSAGNIKYGRYFRHMMNNCKTAASKAHQAVIKNGSEGHMLAWKMAKAKTTPVYDAAYEKLLVSHKFCAE